MAAEFRSLGTVVLWCGLNGVDSHSRRIRPLSPLSLLPHSRDSYSFFGNAIGSGLPFSKCSQLPKQPFGPFVPLERLKTILPEALVSLLCALD